MAKRKKHQITEYEKCLREYHKASPRHVIVLETDLLEDEETTSVSSGRFAPSVW